MYRLDGMNVAMWLFLAVLLVMAAVLLCGG